MTWGEPVNGAHSVLDGGVRAAVIVNADDFGYTPGVSTGILSAFRDGVLSSTTAMLVTESVESAVAQAVREAPEMPIGVHLVLTYGQPLSPPNEVPSLVGPDGAFHRLPTVSAAPDLLLPDEVEREWRRQIERLIGFGVAPDHLDSHHHVSYLHPQLAEVMLRLAVEFDLPVRWPPPPPETHPEVAPLLAAFRGRVWMPDLFVGELMRGSSATKFAALVQGLPDGMVAEFMTHPGVVDAELCAVSSYAHPRGPELTTLLDPSLPACLARDRVRLVTFGRAAARASTPG